jgi:hypothetical protein
LDRVALVALVSLRLLLVLLLPVLVAVAVEAIVQAAVRQVGQEALVVVELAV